MSVARTPYLLIADDYGLSPAVSAGILDLARAGRLSGTSAMVNLPAFPAAARAGGELRSLLSLGLHLNLTLGRPVSAMARQAPDGRLPGLSTWIGLACSGRIAEAEIETEILCQIEAFAGAIGALPDHIDGHHHVHALPGIRSALGRVLQRLYPAGALPLVRQPGDRIAACLGRGAGWSKALVLAGLSAGASRRWRRLGAPVNGSFAGFSRFRCGEPFEAELDRFERAAGRLHLVMCHPGHPEPAGGHEATAAAGDPVVARRAEEWQALAGLADLPDRLVHPARYRDENGRICWDRALA